MKPFQSEKHISASETAQMLGISETSVKNWVRHGFIETAVNDKDNCFLEDDVISLRSRILSGDLKRLNSRANKSNSLKTFMPEELFETEEEKRSVSEISSFIMRHNVDVSSAMFFLSLNLLQRKGMLEGTSPEEILYSQDINIKKRKRLSETLLSWRDSLTAEVKPEFFEILKVRIPDHSNITGIIYQSILIEGDKSKLGMYYTPDKVVSEIIGRIASPDNTFLDPCCGTGQFLLAFSDITDNPENIYGIDIDPIAVNVAKINLFMKYSNADFNPKIFYADSLLDFNESILMDDMNRFSEFDCIATNPPWGSHFNKKELKYLKNYYPEILSGESFSYFLVKSLRMLKTGGVLSFVLPESILNVKIHSDIRKYIFNNYHISRIEQKKKIFKNVFSTAAVIDICNIESTEDVEIVNICDSYKIDNERFGRNSNFIFDINVDSADEKILGKVYSCPYLTLKENAIWALGVVTGNNSKYIQEEKNQWNEPVIKGKDVSSFRISDPDTFIKFEPHKFQQTADVSFYRSKEKLIYKYISNRLIFAYDKEQRITLNSANILIPQISGVDIKVIMALFNSELYQYIFQKKFSSVKVLRSHLEELPVPQLKEEQYNYILKLVKEIEAGSSIDDLNEYVYKIFKLKKSEIVHVKSRVK
ncbi:MAG: restriction endonuclease subunit M [Spirochaetae bacterium HGW-Spirochaetae-5]|nr:MAG: restriction endonuclease subunit M [Spirochaetae bacterium HGW-Spirochaetae-5]